MAATSRGEALPALPHLPAGEADGWGVFVSLHRGGELRGCVGHLEPDRPLAVLTGDMAVAASRDDPRFAPVAAAEVAGLEVEVSLVSAPEAARPEDIVAGRHGVRVRRGPRQGVLLPQVAEELGWDAETLLAMACRKAGLAPLAWRERGTEVSVFRARVVRDRP